METKEQIRERLKDKSWDKLVDMTEYYGKAYGPDQSIIEKLDTAANRELQVIRELLNEKMLGF